MNVRLKLASLPFLTVDGITGNPVEVHEMYNHAGFIIGLKTETGELELKTISYKAAEDLTGEKK